MGIKEKLSLHPKQMQVYQSKARFRVVVAGRRWGKSQLSKILMISKARIPKQKVWYVAPTYKMAKQIMWNDLLDAIPKSWIAKVNESNLSIRLVN
ncbi:terminase, partial [Acinetobacter baumannii]|nr:terminase [Acinetobacter baumannii]